MIVVSRRQLIGGSSVAVVAVIIGLLAFGGSSRDRGDAAVTSSSGRGSNSSASDSDSKKPGRVTNGKASEVTKQPEGSATNGLPGLARSVSAKNNSLVHKPLPKTASSRGKVVNGFPLAIIPLLPGSVAQTSGVSSTSTALQVSLQARNTHSPDTILAFYRKVLAALGFAESTAPSTGDSTAANFSRGADNLVVTVTKSRSKSAIYSIFGTLHAGKSR